MTETTWEMHEWTPLERAGERGGWWVSLLIPGGSLSGAGTPFVLDEGAALAALRLPELAGRKVRVVKVAREVVAERG